MQEIYIPFLEFLATTFPFALLLLTYGFDTMSRQKLQSSACVEDYYRPVRRGGSRGSVEPPFSHANGAAHRAMNFTV